MTRRVVVLFGPPAAGKSTAAQGSGLRVLDRDVEPWASAGERRFRAELEQLRLDDRAAAVVVRTGATREARRRTLEQVGATHAWLMLTPPAECRARARIRGRGNVRRDYAGIAKWWAAFDGAGDVPVWPGGWPDLDLVDELAVDPLAPRCPRCGQLHLSALPCWRGRYATETTALVLSVYGRLCVHCLGANGPATTADHKVPRSKGGTDDITNLEPSCVSCNSQRGNQRDAPPAPAGSTLSSRWRRTGFPAPPPPGDHAPPARIPPDLLRKKRGTVDGAQE